MESNIIFSRRLKGQKAYKCLKWSIYNIQFHAFSMLFLYYRWNEKYILIVELVINYNLPFVLVLFVPSTHPCGFLNLFIVKLFLCAKFYESKWNILF
jgi:hypothetical protein